ncbi:MAG: HAMP domain-containing histidine kinase [Chloroflexi bacterium]|nr:HAMP domain-containing histidine kinase [Chloroflexota bacterium]
MSATPSPSAEGPAARRARLLRSPFRGLGSLPRRALRRLRHLTPRTLQARLTVAFAAVVAATLILVAMFVINRVGAYFDQQQEDDLVARARGVAQYVILIAQSTSSVRAGHPVVTADGLVDPVVAVELGRADQQRIMADTLAQSDIRVRLGLLVGGAFVASSNGSFDAAEQAPPEPGQTREQLTSVPLRAEVGSAAIPYAVEVTLVNPYTFRASAMANIAGLLAVIGLVAMAVAMLVAATLARRFTTPLRRLTEASRDLAEGDLARRVPAESVRDGATEVLELGLQFNMMAERLQESVDIIRRDRDRSREFLADVSHELRTPIAALRTFNELLVEGAADDPMTRAEFLESSRAQLERLDWLAQNLLELSKLDSGLVLLDLRPEDLRATVEQAVEGAATAARRRSIELTLDVPDEPVQIRHDPVRMGQVITNLVGNGLKFTARGGHVRVRVERLADGASISVADDGAGIDPAELPKVFDRFFRGSRASDARGSGSGLGLAIVKSIVEMHGGSVSVETLLGAGSTFRVTLPAAPPLDGVVDSSSTEGPNRNRGAAS